jgi:hypothetical protein
MTPVPAMWLCTARFPRSYQTIGVKFGLDWALGTIGSQMQIASSILVWPATHLTTEAVPSFGSLATERRCDGRCATRRRPFSTLRRVASDEALLLRRERYGGPNSFSTLVWVVSNEAPLVYPINCRLATFSTLVRVVSNEALPARLAHELLDTFSTLVRVVSNEAR